MAPRHKLLPWADATPRKQCGGPILSIETWRRVISLCERAERPAQGFHRLLWTLPFNSASNPLDTCVVDTWWIGAAVLVGTLSREGRLWYALRLSRAALASPDRSTDVVSGPPRSVGPATSQDAQAERS
jgi:hypothetical protein